jgi:hypothetical protein
LTPPISSQEVGRAGGAQRHGTAVSGGARGGARRLAGGRGRPARGRLAPDRPRLDRPLRARRTHRTRRPLPPPVLVPAPDRCRDRSTDLRAAQGTPGLGSPPDRIPTHAPGRGPGALAFVHLPVPASAPADRAPAPAQAPRRVPPLGAGASDAAVADGRDGRGSASRRHRAEGGHRS